MQTKTKKHTRAGAAQDILQRQHGITKTTASAMVKRYKAFRNQVLLAQKGCQKLPFVMPELPLSLTFNREAVAGLLALEGCVGIRMYLAVNPQNMPTLVLSGVDGEGENILGNGVAVVAAKSAGKVVDVLLDEGQTCPPYPPARNVL